MNNFNFNESSSTIEINRIPTTKGPKYYSILTIKFPDNKGIKQNLIVQFPLVESETIAREMANSYFQNL